MGMKAGKGTVVDVQVQKHRLESRDQKVSDFPERRETQQVPRDNETSNPDELVMVMMPRESWNAFQALAQKHGGTTAQAISTSLKLLEKALEETEKK